MSDINNRVNFSIDLVIPYVDNTTEEWQKTYVDFCSSHGYSERVNNFGSERYRDWGFFKYFFRGLEKNLPFINKVFLILQDENQVPRWLNRESVEIVYHRDFIPEEFLPTYNSTTFEMFLDKIPGLSEHFIYANDDMYPINPMTAEDFFTPDGKIKMGFREKERNQMQFTIVCCRCYNEISKALGLGDKTPKYLSPFHEYTPMIKSHVTKTLNLLGLDNIYNGITPFRQPCNHNQYIFPIYELLAKNAVQPERTYIYANMEGLVKEVANALLTTKAHIFVLNDNEKTDLEKWGNDKSVYVSFNNKFPVASKYEIKPKVSVCVCMYNATEGIERCLKSIPNREDIEVVLLDDQSTDGCLEKSIQLLQGYPNYSILSNRKNMGVGYNRNVLIERSSGEYIFFLDSDDYLYTDIFIDLVDHYLTDQNVLMPKYIRNDGFNEYPTIFRGTFLKREWIGNFRFRPDLRCYEDVDFKKRLIAERGDFEVLTVNVIAYHYNKPRIGSLTWEYRKAIGDPSYQKDEKLWEEYRKGRRG